MKQKVDIENQKSQMRKGILEFCTLLTISRKKKYATEIIGELREADLIVVEGTLYPLLSRLRHDGLLSYRWEESPSGPPRKYYTLTDKGEETLKSLKETWSTLSESITTLIKEK
jgi:PadR family transcriptional regulator, regulatory protein PadR